MKHAHGAYIGLCISWCLILITIGWSNAGTPPDKAIVTDAEIVEWYDGDTAVVNVTTQYRVRLLDCWAPEVKGDEKESGLKSKEYIKSICPEGSTVRLKIPTTGRLQDSLTFGRVLGEIWSQSEDGEWHNVSDQMVKDGFATKTKER